MKGHINGGILNGMLLKALKGISKVNFRYNIDIIIQDTHVI